MRCKIHFGGEGRIRNPLTEITPESRTTIRCEESTSQIEPCQCLKRQQAHDYSRCSACSTGEKVIKVIREHRARQK